MDLFELNRDDITFEIKERKTDKKFYDDKIFREYKELSDRIYHDVMYKNLIHKFNTQIIIGLMDQNRSWSIFPNENFKEIYLKKFDKDIEFKKREEIKWDNKTKYKSILANMTNDTIYHKYLKENNNTKNNFYFNYNIKILLLLYFILEENGNFLLTINNYILQNNIELIYLLLILFKDVLILSGRYFLCSNFNPKITKREFIQKIVNKKFDISPKPKLDELIKYLEKSFKYNVKILTLLEKKDFDKLDDIYYRSYLYYINKISGRIAQSELTEILIYFNNFYSQIAKKSYNKNSDKLIDIKAAVGKEEGKYLNNLLKKFKLKKCLEVGLAFGISSINILSAIYKFGGTLVSIDPNQSGKWNNMGKKLIINSGLGKYHKIIEDKSYNAMPGLLKKEEGTYDFIFIDGWHTFDYTLIDFFYADKLLKIGGFIVIDDIKHRGVKKTIKYLDTNYFDYYKRIYKIKNLECPNSFATYKKLKEDTRNWDFHRNF